MAKCGLLLLSTLVLAAAGAGTVRAQASEPIRVAVERFRGPQGGSLRNGLVANLQEAGIEVIPLDIVQAKARDLFGRARIGDDDYPEVAKALNITAFIDGRVSRQRRRWGLRVRVRNAADGMVLGTARWGGRTVGALRGVRRNGHDKLQQYLALASSPAPQPPVQERLLPQQVPPTGDDGSPWYSEDEQPAELPEGPPDESAPQSRDHDRLRIGLLLGSLKRSMSTNVLVDPAFRPGANADAPVQEVREYNASGLGHMEVGVAAEIFPGAFLEEPVAEWLGLAFAFRNSVLLETNGPACDPVFEPLGAPARCPAAGGLVPIDTTQREYYVGATVEYGLGGVAGGPYILGELGYGRFLFDLDQNALALLDRPTIVPPMDYSYLHIGAGLKVGLHPSVLLAARLAYRQGFSVGDPAKRIWGITTEGFRGWRLGGDLIHYLDWASENLYAVLTVEYFRFRTEFSGAPACLAPDSEGFCEGGALWEPWWRIEEGFTDPVDDNYLRLGLTLGYVY